MIKVYNRQTGGYEIEKVPGDSILQCIYGTGAGRLTLEMALKRKLYSSITGLICNSTISTRKIGDFVKKFDIDLSDSIENIDDFKSFNDFFTRKLKPEARCFSTDENAFTSPGDGRLRAWENINIDSLVQVKDFTYSLKELIGNNALAEEYDGGICLILRLAPADYHRFHFVDDGVCSKSRRIKGYYYSVNPVALKSIPKLFCRNKREYSVFHSKHFGDIIYVEIGATSVGSIVQTYKPDIPVVRGDEKGYFKFGGSTIILFLKKDTVKIDADILEQTEAGFESRVLAGEAIGKRQL